MAESGGGIADSRWRYLPLGPAAALPHQIASALRCALFGLLGLAGTAMVAGFLGEELLAGTEVGTTLDLVGRGVLGALLSLGAAGLLAWGLARAFHGPLSARGLSRAAGSMPPSAVPHPVQWEAAREPSGAGYLLVAVIVLFVASIGLAAAVWGVMDGTDGSWAILAGIGGGMALLAGGIPLTRGVMGRWQRRHFEVVRAHWTEPHRIIAAGHVITRAEFGARRKGLPPEEHPAPGVRRLERALFAILGTAAAVGLTALQAALALVFPDREPWPGGRPGDRADLSDTGEQLVDLLILIFSVCALIGLLAYLGTVACDVVIHRVATRRFRAVLADPEATLPPHRRLVAQLAPTSPPSLRVLQTLAGAAVGFGAALWFVGAVADDPDWRTYSVAGSALRAAGPLGGWSALGALALLTLSAVVGTWLHQREQPLRDVLVQRWPVRAEVGPNDDADDEGEG